MLAQTLYNALYFAPVQDTGYYFYVEGGGTYGKFAPGVSYLNNVTYKILHNLGYEIKINVKKHGFFPKGGALSEILIHPNRNKYKGLILTPRPRLSSLLPGAASIPWFSNTFISAWAKATQVVQRSSARSCIFQT